MSQIKSLFGGRLAEELTFGPAYVTTGASNDIERATDIARNMVTKWGLSDKLGPLTYSEDDGEVFLGRSVTRHKHVSDGTAHAIDEEIRGLIDSCYQEARQILKDNADKLKLMAEALIKYETIDENQIADIMKGDPPRPPEDWDEPTDPGEPVQAKSEPSDGGAAPLGGPASQH
jgi:cell division protease FtsH